MDSIDSVMRKIESRSMPHSASPHCKYCGNEYEFTYERRNADHCTSVECISQTRREHAARVIDTLIVTAGIPQKFHTLMTDKDISSYRNLKRGLYIYGPVGVGKTVFACSLAKQALLEGRKVRFLNVIELILSLYDMWRKPEEQMKKYIDKEIIDPEILVLDDIGSEKITEYVRTTFLYIFNQREVSDKITIITSNYSLVELDTHIGCDRISSRIAGACEIVNMLGNDRRLEKGKE